MGGVTDDCLAPQLLLMEGIGAEHVHTVTPSLLNLCSGMPVNHKYYSPTHHILALVLAQADIHKLLVKDSSGLEVWRLATHQGSSCSRDTS